DAAEPLLKRALRIREKLQGADNPLLGTSLDQLAIIYLGIGDVTQARTLYERSLKLRERALGPDQPLTRASYNNLGLLYLRQSDFPRAKSLLEKALGDGSGLDPVDRATIQANLGLPLLDMGDPVAARELN